MDAYFHPLIGFLFCVIARSISFSPKTVFLQDFIYCCFNNLVCKSLLIHPFAPLTQITHRAIFVAKYIAVFCVEKPNCKQFSLSFGNHLSGDRFFEFGSFIRLILKHCGFVFDSEYPSTCSMIWKPHR